MNFIRVSTRLYCDVYEAYRALTAERRLVKYFNYADDCLRIGGQTVKINISEKEPYQKVVWSMTEIGGNAAFYIMRSAVKTEYCTEIHLVLEKDGRNLTEPEASTWRLMGEALLEVLREGYNKDWIITDEDLNRGEFRGSF